MFSEKQILDSKVFLYKNNIDNELINAIEKINTIESIHNVWEVASYGNIKNNEHVYEKKIINLPVGNVLYPVALNMTKINDHIFNIKNMLEDLFLPCILDYAYNNDIKIKKHKHFTVCAQDTNSLIHNDLDKDGDKYSTAALMLINDDFVGGDLYFENRIGNQSIKMHAGDIIIYPTNSQYPHYESPITDGIKYTAISYFN